MFKKICFIILSIIVVLTISSCKDEKNVFIDRIAIDDNIEYNVHEDIECDKFLINGSNIKIDGNNNLKFNEFKCEGENIKLNNIHIKGSKLIFINCNNLILSNLDITLSDGIELINCSNVTISNNIIRGNGTCVNAAINGNLNIENNKIYNSSDVLVLKVKSGNDITINFNNNYMNAIKNSIFNCSVLQANVQNIHFTNNSIIQSKNTILFNTKIDYNDDYKNSDIKIGNINEINLFNILQDQGQPLISILGVEDKRNNELHKISMLTLGNITLHRQNIDGAYDNLIIGLIDYINIIKSGNNIATGANI